MVQFTHATSLPRASQSDPISWGDEGGGAVPHRRSDPPVDGRDTNTGLTAHTMTHEDSARRRARRATLFLDVDGVLNSFPVTGARFYRERRRKAHAWNYELHYRPSVIRRLERLVETRLLDLVWLSTWSDRCTTELEPTLGFRGTYPVIPMPDDSYNRFAGDPASWWKAHAVEAWLAEHPDERAVWVDDDLAAPVTYSYFTETYPDRLLLIAPEFRRGLTFEHLRRILAFTYPRPRSGPGSTRLLSTRRTPAPGTGVRPEPASSAHRTGRSGSAVVAPEGIGRRVHGKDES